MLRYELHGTKLLSGRTYEHMHSSRLLPLVGVRVGNGTFLELFVDLLHGKIYIVSQIFIMAMQDVINKMKGTALGVAEYLTPVLKVVYTLLRKAKYGSSCLKYYIVDLPRKWISFSCFYTGVEVSGNWRDYTRRGIFIDISNNINCFLTVNLNFALRLTFAIELSAYA